MVRSCLPEYATIGRRIEVTDDLNSILVECAKLRGCYPLMHRTLSELDWFCKAIIHGWTQYDQYQMDEMLTEYPDAWSMWSYARDEKESIKNRWNAAYEYGDNELIHLARAFLDYCRTTYMGEA